MKVRSFEHEREVVKLVLIVPEVKARCLRLSVASAKGPTSHKNVQKEADKLRLYDESSPTREGYDASNIFQEQGRRSEDTNAVLPASPPL
jgi:hypothetical protein